MEVTLNDEDLTVTVEKYESTRPAEIPFHIYYACKSWLDEMINLDEPVNAFCAHPGYYTFIGLRFPVGLLEHLLNGGWEIEQHTTLEPEGPVVTTMALKGLRSHEDFWDFFS